MDSAFYVETALAFQGTGADAELVASVRSEPACGGPWSDDLQHGGPPTALLVRMAERLARQATDRDDLTALRVAAEFVGTVPVSDLAIRARITRFARSAVLVSAELEAAGRPCLQARIWLLSHPGSVDREPADSAYAKSDPPGSSSAFAGWTFPYVRHLDWRLVSGTATEPGPAAAWVAPRVPLILGERLSSLQRAALIADSASGISAELDWAHWSFPNVDLDLHLLRPMTGEWLLMDARTLLGDGAAMTRSVLSDSIGEVGAGLQTVLVRPRT
ncbi:MAG TPA: thioesterase family protein [Jatrophihabitans sp.]